MTNTGKQIAHLMMDTSKSAPDMTHAMKVLGNGSMQKGFDRIREFFTAEVAAANTKGLTTGRIQGGIAGVLGTTAFGSLVILILNKSKKKAAHEVEGLEILKAMDSSIPVSYSPVDANDTSIISSEIAENFDSAE